MAELSKAHLHKLDLGQRLTKQLINSEYQAICDVTNHNQRPASENLISLSSKCIFSAMRATAAR